MEKEIKKESSHKEGEIQRAEPRRIMSPFEEIDRMFEGVIPRGWLRPFRWERPWEMAQSFESRMPRMDILDRDNDILVRAEIPGVNKDDIDISVTDNTVTIKGDSKREEKDEKGEYYRCEIYRGSFSRTAALPSDVDPEKAKATFKDGVIELTLPKVEKAKRRSIKVE